MGVTVSITARTSAGFRALAKVTRNNQLVTLAASRDLRFTQKSGKQMTARGYMIGPNSAVNLQIIVNQLYADVSHGAACAANIATKRISRLCDRGKWRQDDQNYRANYSIEGAFRASNQNIADAVSSVLTDTIA